MGVSTLYARANNIIYFCISAVKALIVFLGGAIILSTHKQGVFLWILKNICRKSWKQFRMRSE